MASDSSRFGLHVGMLPTLERLTSKQFFSSNPLHDLPIGHHSTGLSITCPLTGHQKGNAAPIHDLRTGDANISKNALWPQNLDPALARSHPPLPPQLPSQHQPPSQPQAGPSEPRPPERHSTLHWGPSTTYHLDNDAMSGPGKLVQSSKHDNGH